jgi:hypothetical protein
MSKINTVERHTGKHEQIPLKPAAVSSQDEGCWDAAGHRTLYVLGFGVLGAISTNTLVFIYFVSFYASG